MTSSIRTFSVPLAVVVALVAGFGFTRPAQDKIDTATPPALVASYNSLADAILAVKATEANLVRAMLDGGHAHAKALLAQAQAAIDAGKKDEAKLRIESLAALVAQLGAEGDNAVAGVRKRLLDGGHHHNAEGEKQGLYEPGYVIVTKTAKANLLAASKAIAQVASAPDKAALDKAWASVDSAWAEISKAR
ncbi:MAG TPA: hypothetical protein VFF36_15635 [Planctomycetota bacterium]|nr:hypothetical protein [Planctomycetota bacterium]